MRKSIVSIAILFLTFWQVVMAGERAVAAQGKHHFITDDAYRSKVENTFEKKMNLVGKQFYQVKRQKLITDAKTKNICKDLVKKKLTNAEQEALQFLYAYMPVADVTDYPTSFFLQNVRTSFEARREMPWGQEIPELLFRHFVLPIRVNNENLDDSRQVFYKELKERVKGMNMKNAILEVNHWCHERVTYQPSDARTSAPLSTIRSAYGRCGEESTFTVAALRAIGIPARQVYTPRWAHTDDNHAWVEAWADGKWYFLGACEPEAVLNLAWFNAPASRAMLMHTKAFGDYNGPEEVMLRTSNYTEINLIDNYGSSARIDFSVVDTNGKPVDGARVDFKIYNYAEFCSVVTKYTSSDGKTFLSAGKGDMMVWASKAGKYGFAKASFGKDKAITICLNHEEGKEDQVFYRDSFDIVPPPEKANIPEVSAEARTKNLERFAYEDSIRHAYLATFFNQETAFRALREKGLIVEKYLTRNGIATWVAKGEELAVSTPVSPCPISEKDKIIPDMNQVETSVACGINSTETLKDKQDIGTQRISAKAQKMVDFLVASWGNHAVVLDFLVQHQDQLDRTISLLSTLSAKDLRDMQVNILEDSFLASSDQLSPRVEDEMIISPFKQFFEQEFGKMKSTLKTDAAGAFSHSVNVKQSLAQSFKNDPRLLVEWVKQNIRLNPDKKALQIAQTPVGVWKSRLTDERSRKIFFVDVARSLGIEARVDAVTKKLQYRMESKEDKQSEKNGWIDVDFDKTSSIVSRKGILKLDYQVNGAVDDPKYYSHFTLTRINTDGSTSLLEYPEEGCTWSNTFKNGIELDEGDYALVSGTRLANGGVLSEMQLLHVISGETLPVTIHLRTSQTEVTVKGNFDSESKFLLLNQLPNSEGLSESASDKGENLKEVSLLSQTGRGYFITGLIGVGQEPTNHALKDIAKVAQVFERWNRPIVLLFEDEASAHKFRINEFPGLPNNIIFGIDKDGVIRKQLVDNMKLTNANLLPIFTISDTFNRVVYVSQGYTIGLGEQLETIIKKL